MLVVAAAVQGAGMVMEQGVLRVREVDVFSAVEVRFVLMYATTPLVVTHAIPTLAPATKLVLVMVKRNLPTATVAPGSTGAFVADAELPRMAVEVVSCIRRLDAVYDTL